ncbi:UDP-4-amino-4,6-dideoxy-N-acetyl-beta-L-altrosamine transaminase [uncultured Clostridium sp.]|jgi:UDP-4-amino-4,6-dideoxy-N-acetyl-beta-L-altrosamine transaminase|uniref:UDP-4-amino-4, 6-dideoxy-N-acetyl-beta-L-altrosamine transaminase n=1 Tax=uncultured Clostridium sp. TaxID=59620 RepID=UPI002617A1D2|nr:UDP-4-amino-4,6-dideoxy-N-acetyl-beta-L-altrosamine transaminase [uncultured Clostridium sp.]
MSDLAINGGIPVRDTYLDYGKQSISGCDIEEVIKVLKSGYLTTGPMVAKFENEVAKYVGCKYAVAVTNGTAALHIAMLASNIKEGDEVLVTPMTFAASVNCILYCGGTPVFIDIEKDTGNIDVSKIEEKITSKTKAIIAVDFAGHAVDIDSIMKIAKKHNLIVVEDAAHALGSEYNGIKVGNKADMTTFSFHPVKPITTGEGGMVVTNSEELYKKLSLYRTHGITRDSGILENQEEEAFYYEQQSLGYNYRIPDINCALGISQLTKIDYFIKKRRSIVEKYNELLKEFDCIETPIEKDYSKSGYHIYVIKLKLDKIKKSRNQIFKELRAENIGVNVHYIPVYYHPYYKDLGYKKGLCENTEEFYEKIITLPLYPKMKKKDIEDVITALRKILK